jgi:BirA family transcriptional regulator, biotin operon repressor / biotin---[acetyl-CoA-carboxylase] ligase
VTDWPEGYGLLELAETDSTNQEACRRAQAGETGPLWISAAQQHAGRGRRGRAWTLQPGNLAATLLIRPGRPAALCAQLSFAAALSVADMLAPYSHEVRLKWPNDVLASGKKIAGILLESESGAEGLTWLAIGIGVNLAAFPEDTDLPAVSLKALGAAPPGPREALSGLAAAFAKWYEIWRTAGFAPLREAWLSRASGLGRRIRVRLAKEEIAGTFRDIDEAGALVVGLPQGVTRVVSAGEVFF